METLRCVGRALITAMVRIVFALIGGLRVEGAERVPAAGPVLIAPNHLSVVDPPAIGLALRRPAHYMASTEVFRVPVISSLARLMRAFPVRQDSPDRAALRHAERLLRGGEVLVIFPEGHVSETGQLQPLTPGVVMLALRAQAPILPVAIEGTDRIAPYGRMLPRRTRQPAVVRFGEPIPVEDLSGGMTGRPALDHGVAVLTRALEELLARREQPREAGADSALPLHRAGHAEYSDGQ